VCFERRHLGAKSTLNALLTNVMEMGYTKLIRITGLIASKMNGAGQRVGNRRSTCGGFHHSSAARASNQRVSEWIRGTRSAAIGG
jgi:hypothetical protein